MRVALDSTRPIYSREGLRLCESRALLFYVLLASSLEPGLSISRARFKKSLLVLLRAPYRHKLAKKQLVFSRQRLLIDLGALGSLLSAQELVKLSPGSVSISWMSLCRSGRATKWLA